MTPGNGTKVQLQFCCAFVPALRRVLHAFPGVPAAMSSRKLRRMGLQPEYTERLKAKGFYTANVLNVLVLASFKKVSTYIAWRTA